MPHGFSESFACLVLLRVSPGRPPSSPILQGGVMHPVIGISPDCRVLGAFLLARCVLDEPGASYRDCHGPSLVEDCGGGGIASLARALSFGQPLTINLL